MSDAPEKKKDDDVQKPNAAGDADAEAVKRARKRKAEEDDNYFRIPRIDIDPQDAGIDPRTGRKRREPTWDDLSFAALNAGGNQTSNDSLQSLLGKPANDILAMAATEPAAGQPVLGHAVANLGAGASESRLKSVAKTVGGMAVPAVATIAAKAAFAMAATAAFPAYAPILVPVAFAAWSVISLTKSARTLMKDLNEASKEMQDRQKIGRVKAFRMALNQNKFKAGMLIGSAVMLSLGLSGTLDNLAEPVTKLVTGSELGSKLSGMMEGASNIFGGSSPSQAGAVASLSPSPVPLSPEEVHQMASDLAVETPAPAAADAPPAPVAAEPQAELAKVPQDQFRELIANQNVSQDVKDAAERMLSTDPKIAAQATKDAAFHLLNGIGMDGGNEKLALALFKEAADAGNVQAKVDLAYLQYHGLAGVEAEPKAAIAAMQEIKTDARAANFVSAWTGNAAQAATPVVTAPPASTSTFTYVPEPRLPDTGIPDEPVRAAAETTAVTAKAETAPSAESSQFIRQPTPQEILQEKMNAAGDRAFSSDPAVADAAKREWADLNRQMEALNKGTAPATDTATATAQNDAKPAAAAAPAPAKADVPASTPTDTRTVAEAAKDTLGKANSIKNSVAEINRLNDILRRR